MGTIRWRDEEREREWGGGGGWGPRARVNPARQGVTSLYTIKRRQREKRERLIDTCLKRFASRGFCLGVIVKKGNMASAGCQ